MSRQFSLHDLMVCMEQGEFSDEKGLHITGTPQQRGIVRIQPPTVVDGDTLEVLAPGQTLKISHCDVYCESIDSVVVQHELVIENCTLHQEGEWARLRFERPVTLQDVEVETPLFFHACVFRQNLICEQSIFQHDWDLSGCRFLGNIRFEKNVYHGSVLFDEGELSPLVSGGGEYANLFADDLRQFWNDLFRSRLLRSPEEVKSVLQERRKHLQRRVQDVKQWFPNLTVERSDEAQRHVLVLRLVHNMSDSDYQKCLSILEFPSTWRSRQSRQELASFFQETTNKFRQALQQRLGVASSAGLQKEQDAFLDAVLRETVTWDCLELGAESIYPLVQWQSPESGSNHLIQQLQVAYEEETGRPFYAIPTLVVIDEWMKHINIHAKDSTLYADPPSWLQKRDGNLYRFWRKWFNSFWLVYWRDRCNSSDLELFQAAWSNVQQWVQNLLLQVFGDAPIMTALRSYLFKQGLEIALGLPSLLQRMLPLLQSLQLNIENDKLKFRRRRLQEAPEFGDKLFMDRLQNQFLRGYLGEQFGSDLEQMRSQVRVLQQVLHRLSQALQKRLPDPVTVLQQSSEPLQQATIRGLGRIAELETLNLQEEGAPSSAVLARQLRRAALVDPDRRCLVVGTLQFNNCTIYGGLSCERLLCTMSIRLEYTRILGTLVREQPTEYSICLDNARFWNASDEQFFYHSLELNNSHLGGSLSMRRAFLDGSVHCLNTQIDGSLDLNAFIPPARHQKATVLRRDLILRRTKIAGDLLLQRAELRWLHAHGLRIEGSLQAHDTIFRVGVYLPHSHFEGSVDFRRARVGTAESLTPGMRELAVSHLGRQGQWGEHGIFERFLSVKHQNLDEASEAWPFGLAYFYKSVFQDGINLYELRSPTAVCSMGYTHLFGDVNANNARVGLLSLHEAEVEGDLIACSLHAGRLVLRRTRIEKRCELQNFDYYHPYNHFRDEQSQQSEQGRISFQERAHIDAANLSVGGRLDLRDLGNETVQLCVNLERSNLHQVLLDNCRLHALSLRRTIFQGSCSIEGSFIDVLAGHDTRFLESLSLNESTLQLWWSPRAHFQRVDGIGLRVEGATLLPECTWEGPVYFASSEKEPKRNARLYGLDWHRSRFQWDVTFGSKTKLSSQPRPSKLKRALARLDIDLAEQGFSYRGMTEVTFKEAFDGRHVNFEKMCWNGANFQGLVRMQYASFSGAQSWHGAQFNQRFDASHATFSPCKDDTEAREIVDVSNASFASTADWSFVKTKLRMKFDESHFHRSLVMRRFRDQRPAVESLRKPQDWLSHVSISFVDVYVSEEFDVTETTFQVPYFGNANLGHPCIDKKTLVRWLAQLKRVHKVKRKELAISSPLDIASSSPDETKATEVRTWREWLEPHRDFVIKACRSQRKLFEAARWQRVGESLLSRPLNHPIGVLVCFVLLFMTCLGINYSIISAHGSGWLTAWDYTLTSIVTHNPIELRSLPDSASWQILLKKCNYAFTGVAILLLDVFLIALGQVMLRK